MSPRRTMGLCDAERFMRSGFRCAALLGRRCCSWLGRRRSPTGGATHSPAAIVQPRQPVARHLHRQFSRRSRGTRGDGNERGPGRGGSDRVCRRTGTGHRRLHPCHVRQPPPPDLIVTVGGPAATFARKHRQQIFPDTPLLLASVDQQYLRDAPLGTTRRPSRSSTISRNWSMTFCSCFPRPGRSSW